jgi:hypothetical protein
MLRSVRLISRKITRECVHRYFSFNTGGETKLFNPPDTRNPLDDPEIAKLHEKYFELSSYEIFDMHLRRPAAELIKPKIPKDTSVAEKILPVPLEANIRTVIGSNRSRQLRDGIESYSYIVCT